MASEFYGFNRGDTEFAVQTGTATNSTDVELRVDLTKSLTKSEVLVILEQLENVLVKDANDIFG